MPLSKSYQRTSCSVPPSKERLQFYEPQDPTTTHSPLTPLFVPPRHTSVSPTSTPACPFLFSPTVADEIPHIEPTPGSTSTSSDPTPPASTIVVPSLPEHAAVLPLGRGAATDKLTCPDGLTFTAMQSYELVLAPTGRPPQCTCVEPASSVPDMPPSVPTVAVGCRDARLPCHHSLLVLGPFTYGVRLALACK